MSDTPAVVTLDKLERKAVAAVLGAIERTATEAPVWTGPAGDLGAQLEGLAALATALSPSIERQTRAEESARLLAERDEHGNPAYL